VSFAPPLIARWEKWVTELEDHALDLSEYRGLLECRSDLNLALELEGSEPLWAEVDAIDARFRAMTIKVDPSPFGEDWWEQQLPANQAHRVYMAQVAAAIELARGVSLTDVAVYLRGAFALSPIATAKALRNANVPLGKVKAAVDASLSDPERAASEQLRDSAEQAVSNEPR
jgi:hypothetical protein